MSSENEDNYQDSGLTTGQVLETENNLTTMAVTSHLDSSSPGKDKEGYSSGDEDYEELDEIFENLKKCMEQNDRSSSLEESRNERYSEALERALDQTFEIIDAKINELKQDGLNVYRQLEKLKVEYQHLVEETEAKTSEIQRLQAKDEKQRKTIQTLMLATEADQSRAVDQAQRALVEAELRAKLNFETQEKNEALRTAQTQQARCSLLEEQTRQLKSKYQRVVQEKIHMERDQRLQMSFTKDLESRHQSTSTFASDQMESYKRKVNELMGQVQALQAIVAEKNRLLEQRDRQLEDSLVLKDNKKRKHDD